MIHLVEQKDYATYQNQLTQMFELRADIFHERLGWDVQVEAGQERDCFDDSAPLYVLSLNEDGDVLGSLRLLPTTGPNMLTDVFSCLLQDGETVRSPVIWESSRFCVSPAAEHIRSNAKVNPVTAELLAAVYEVGLLVGLQSVASVYDIRIKRVLRQAGCEAIQLGEPRQIGKVKAFAGLFPMTPGTLAQVRAACDLSSSVLQRALPNVKEVA